MLREGDKGSNAFIQHDAVWKCLIVGGAFTINVTNTIRRLDHSWTYTLDDIVATSLIREVATKIVCGEGTDKKFSSILRKC